MMIWDSFAPHKSPRIIDYLAAEFDTNVCIIPGGCTSVLQPLDVGVNKPMKDRLRAKFQSWIAKRANDASNDVPKVKSNCYLLYVALESEIKCLQKQKT